MFAPFDQIAGIHFAHQIKVRHGRPTGRHVFGHQAPDGGGCFNTGRAGASLGKLPITSAVSTAPSGPNRKSIARSRPRSAASLRALGEARILAGEPVDGSGRTCFHRQPASRILNAPGGKPAHRLFRSSCRRAPAGKDRRPCSSAILRASGETSNEAFATGVFTGFRPAASGSGLFTVSGERGVGFAPGYETGRHIGRQRFAGRQDPGDRLADRDLVAFVGQDAA